MVRGWRSRIRAVPIATLVSVVLLITPSLLLLYYVGTFGVNVIFWDDWEKVTLVRKTMGGTLSFSDLWVQHNEHRMPLPNLLMCIIEILTRYNMVVVMFFSWVVLCMTGLLMFCIHRRNSKSKSYSELSLTFLPVLLLLFSFRQWESILWAITFQIYLMTFCVVATFFLLDKSRNTDVWFALGLASAVLAPFSFLPGLAVWPVGGLQMAISKGRSGLRRIILWALTSVGVFVPYFWGYVKPTIVPPLDYALTHPLEAARYFLVSVGSPLFWDSTTMAGAAGAVLVSITVLALIHAFRRRLLGRYSLWLSVILFVGSFSLFATVGRSGFGVEQALQSRYTPVTLLGGASVYLFALSVLGKHIDAKRLLAYCLLALAVTGIASSYLLGCYKGWGEGQSMKLSREVGAYVLLTYKMQSDENIRNYLYIDTGLVRNHAEFLERNGLSVFSRPVIDASTLTLTHSNTLFAFDTIDGESIPGQNVSLTVDSGQHETITITGWAVDEQAGDVASTVFIVIDDVIRIPVIYGLDRKDVAASLGNPSFRLSGFMATFSSTWLGLSKHSVSLEIASKGDYYYSENNVLSLTVS